MKTTNNTTPAFWHRIACERKAQRDAAVAALRQAHEALATIEGKARTRQIINAYCRADNTLAAAEKGN